MDQHMIPVVGLQRVVGVEQAPQHAQHGRLPWGERLSLRRSAAGASANSGILKRMCIMPMNQTIRLARAVDEIDPVRNRRANLRLRQHVLVLSELAEV